MDSNILRHEEKKALMELKEDLIGLLGSRLLGFVLFGSRARGDYHGESDLDIAVIVQGLTRKQKNEIFDKVAEIELKYLMPMSTVVFSEEDFNHLKKRERRIALDIETEGRPL